jgi:hypothetical protein
MSRPVCMTTGEPLRSHTMETYISQMVTLMTGGCTESGKEAHPNPLHQVSIAVVQVLWNVLANPSKLRESCPPFCKLRGTPEVTHAPCVDPRGSYKRYTPNSLEHPLRNQYRHKMCLGAPGNPRC